MIWFDQPIKAKHDFLNEDIYNINENNYIIDMAESSKVIFLKYQKYVFINQANNKK